jgi:hypothetical protein
MPGWRDDGAEVPQRGVLNPLHRIALLVHGGFELQLPHERRQFRHALFDHEAKAFCDLTDSARIAKARRNKELE